MGGRSEGVFRPADRGRSLSGATSGASTELTAGLAVDTSACAVWNNSTVLRILLSAGTAARTHPTRRRDRASAQRDCKRAGSAVSHSSPLLAPHTNEITVQLAGGPTFLQTSVALSTTRTTGGGAFGLSYVVNTGCVRRWRPLFEYVRDLCAGNGQLKPRGAVSLLTGNFATILLVTTLNNLTNSRFQQRDIYHRAGRASHPDGCFRIPTSSQAFPWIWS